MPNCKLNSEKFLTFISTFLESLFLLLILMVPLSVTLFTSELFEWPKMMLTYLFTILILFLFLLRSFLQRKIALYPTPFEKFILPFLMLLTLSTLFSLNFYTSFWGYYSRFNGSLLSWLAYFILFYVFLAVFKTKEQLSRFLHFLLASAAIVSIYAVLQKLGIDKNFWVQHSWERVFSTLGQPNWLAAFLDGVIPIALAFFLIKSSELIKFCRIKQIFKLRLKGWLSVLALLSLLILFAFSLIFTQSRSGIAGLLGALGCGVFILIIKLKSKLKLFLLGLLIFATAFLALTKSSSISSFLTEAETTRIRLIVWQGTLNLIAAHPILGTGPETFAYAFLPFRPAQLNQTSEWDFVFNKPHNEDLGIAAGSGLPGLILYIAFSVALSFRTLKFLLKEKVDSTWFLVWGILMAEATLWITNFFGFSVVVTQLLFVLLAACLLILVSSRQPAKFKEYHLSTILRNVGLAFTMVATVLALLFWSRFWLAEVAFVQGKSYLDSDPAAAFKKLQLTVKLNPWEPRYREKLAQAYAKAAATDGNQRPELIRLAAQEANFAYRQNPHDYILREGLIQTYLKLAILEPKYFAEALNLARINVQKSPTNPYDYYFLATLYHSQNRNTEALDAVKAALSLKPDYTQAQDLLTQLE